MKNSYFNINDIVRFKVDDLDSRLKQFTSGDILEEYCNYISDEAIADNELDFTVSIVKSIRTKDGCYVLDDNYHIDDGYLYTADSYKVAKWTIELFRKGNQYNMKIAPNLAARFFISGFFIDFLVQFSLSRKGYSIIHSSGLTKGNFSYLFSGRGGSGKTSTCINLVNLDSSYNILGDDFQIMSKGESIPYITPLNLFTYNASKFLLNGLSEKKKFALSLKKMIYYLSGGYAKFFTKLNPKESFADLIGSRSKISKIFIILPIKSDNVKDLKIQRINKQTAIEHITFNQMMDSRYFPKYLVQYGFMFPNDEFALYWDKYKKNLYENLIEGINYYKILLPFSLVGTKEVGYEIMKVIENE